MADGKLCKTCNCQESEHVILWKTLPWYKTKDQKGIPSYRITRKWARQQIHDFFTDNGITEYDIREFFYDVIRCSGFSITRKRNKNWISFQK